MKKLIGMGVASLAAASVWAGAPVRLTADSAEVVVAAKAKVGSGLPSDWKTYLAGVEGKAQADAAGWTGRITIPRKLLGEVKDSFQINFCRHRVLTDGTVESIVWSPYVHNFHDTERFGTIVFGAKSNPE